MLYNTCGDIMNVLITGMSSLGMSIAKVFINNGYNVIMTYNNNKIDTDIKSIKCDITNDEDINNLINNIKDIDILINNAALSLDSIIEDKTREEFINVLNVNLVSTFILTREIIKNNNIKTIINISSTDSVDTYSSYNIDYSSSKAGLNIVTKTLSDYYKNIKICSVMPNWINTDTVLNMNKEYLDNELKRIGQDKLLDKDDVANLVYEVATNNKYKSGDIVRMG